MIPRKWSSARVKRAQQLSDGVKFLLKKNKVTVVDGEAKLAGKGEAGRFQGRQTRRRRRRQTHIILATGARAPVAAGARSPTAS